MKSLLVFIAATLLCFHAADAQKASGRSLPGPLFPRPKADTTAAVSVPQPAINPVANTIKLPDLSASVVFFEPSGNKMLDEGETGKLILTLSNNGSGTAYRVQVKVTPGSDTAGIAIGRFSPLDSITAGNSRTVDAPIAAAEGITTKLVRLQFDVSEAKGFDLETPIHLTFSARALAPPNLVIADVGVDDQNKNGQIEPREVVDITARIQNTGEAGARNVRAIVQVGENVFVTPDSKTVFDLGAIGHSAYKDIKFTIYTNNRATGVPVNIALTGAEGGTNKILPLSLAFNKPQKKGNELVVEGVQQVPAEADSSATTLSVDIDVNIPTGLTANPDAVAVIFGVEQYRNIPPVSYATRDAAVFQEYAKKVLGVPDDKDHIYYRLDNEVTKGEFDKLFSEHGWLSNHVEQNSDVYIYFAGHGAPDIQEKTPYLIPSDGDANYPTQTGYSVVQLYEQVGKLPVRSVTVFFDACFSGETRENQPILASARPISITIDNPIMHSDKITAFCAASGDQISSGYPDKRHGLFTYFLLKGMRGDADKNNDKSITIQEMDDYLSLNVRKVAGRLDRVQTPQVLGKNKERVLVKY